MDIVTAASADDVLALEVKYLAEICEDAPDAEAVLRLDGAIKSGRIVFFVAKEDGVPVGMCSVSRCFSTFACSDVAQFEDFFVEPYFRHKGVARKLVDAARKWCAEHGISSLTVTSAPIDEEMYQSLGFTEKLGTTYASLI